MPRGGLFLAGLLAGQKPNATNTLARHLTHLEATQLAALLEEDAQDFFYSAAISILDALKGLDDGYFTWPTVSLYYSVFYSLRCILSLGGYCVWYVDHTPYLIRANPAEASKKGEGTTHGAVLASFRATFPNHYLLSQPIGLDDPLDWVRQRREDANYHRTRFSEPADASLFRFVLTDGVRSLVAAYLSRQGGQYTFDPDHAMLAFPLQAFRSAAASINGKGGGTIVDAEAEFMRKKCRDRKASYRTLVELLETCRTANVI